MARRLSPWQQFAANFDSTYGTFNTMFSDIEEGKIMRDEVTELQSGIGPGPRSQQLWSYGGKTYDKEITPDMLTGLRNTRLIDNMAKWGDTEGAMKLRQAQATIDASTASTAAQVQQNELMAKTFQDQVAAYGLQNQQTQANIGLTNANKERILATYPVEKRKMIAEALQLEWDNKYTDATFDFQVDEQEAITGSAVSQAAMDKIEEDEMRLTSTSRVASEISDFETNVDSNVLTKKTNQLKMSEADEAIAVNDMMARFRNRAGKAPEMGGFSGATEKERNENAKAWMVSEMRKINLDLADEMEAKYGANELAFVVQESTMFSEKAMASWKTGGIEGLSKEIDALNGVNGTEIVYNDKNKNIATLWEVNEKGVKVREIATGDLTKENGEGSFLMNLQQALDPARSMAISTEYHNDLKAQADAEYTAAMAEKAKADTKKSLKETELLGKAKPLSDKEYWVQRLVADPNDTVALHGLLGVDLTREEIGDMVENETLRQVQESKEKEKNKISTLDDKDGLVKKVKEEEEVKLVNNSGISGVTQVQVDTSLSQNKQAEQKAAAGREINTRVQAVWDIISADIIPFTLDKNLDAEDLADQKLRDTAKKWLRKNRNYFLTHPKELAAFEENPEQWVNTNITSKGIGSGG